MDPKGDLKAWTPFSMTAPGWGSGTFAGLSYAIMQDDGNLCIYAGSDPGHQGTLQWGSLQNGGKTVDTMPKHASYLLPGDELTGGMVLTSPNGRWTAGIIDGVFGIFGIFHPGPPVSPPLPGLMGTSLALAQATAVTMRMDGNLVATLDGPDDVFWASGTDGSPCFALMQDDGNFCVYQGSSPDNGGQFMWGSLQNGGVTSDLGVYPPTGIMKIYVVNEWNGGRQFCASWARGSSERHSIPGRFGSTETVDLTFTVTGFPRGETCWMTMIESGPDYNSGDNFTFGERGVAYKIEADALNNPRWNRIS
jgi:hypothetical protein